MGYRTDREQITTFADAADEAHIPRGFVKRLGSFFGMSVNIRDVYLDYGLLVRGDRLDRRPV